MASKGMQRYGEFVRDARNVLTYEPGWSRDNHTGFWRAYAPQVVRRVPPCQIGCPGGVPVRDYVQAIRRGEFAAAVRIIREAITLAAVCGRVCDHPCEAVCLRGKSPLPGEPGRVDAPVAIRELKRFVAEQEPHDDASDASMAFGSLASASGKRVAVVGSGPAGLHAARRLACLGHEVHVFEAAPVAGGLLAHGIPAYRLPRDVLRAEIDRVVACGVTLHLNAPVGEGELTLPLLLRTHEAVLLCCGLRHGLMLNIPGDDYPGVFPAISFLAGVLGGEAPLRLTGAEVLVFGGGDAAMDAARVAVRQGARQVRVVYRRDRASMPADPEQVAQAEAEGVQLRFLAAPHYIDQTQDGRLRVCVRRMRLGEADASGRRRPVPIEGPPAVALEEFDVDVVLPAIGQAWDERVLAGLAPEVCQHLTQADLSDGTTCVPGLFVAGDVAHGAATVIRAIGSAERAARQINAMLCGEPDGSARTGGAKPGAKPGAAAAGAAAGAAAADEAAAMAADADGAVHFGVVIDARAVRRARAVAPLRDAYARRGGFDEIVGPLTQQQARDEAERCLSCGACNGCGTCWLVCPDGVITLEMPGPSEEPPRLSAAGDIAAGGGAAGDGAAAVLPHAGGAPQPRVDLAYCKGCGICVRECPREAMRMVREVTVK